MASIVPTCGRTPDHPPYALMIGAAINSLAEEGGSTEESISRYIRSNYSDIPPAHDLLLPYYLKKLTDNAEFAISTPGRYVVPRHVRGEVANADIEEGLPLACDGDVVMAVRASPAKRRRGRLPKEKTAMCIDDGSANNAEPETVTVTRKRRGRLPKCKVEPKPLGEKTGKRRGRPPKSAKKPDEDMLVTAMAMPETPPVSDESKSAVATTEKAGKRRGRPPKSAKKTDEPETTKTMHEIVVATVEKTGKRRGRPPKRKADDIYSLTLQ